MKETKGEQLQTPLYPDTSQFAEAPFFQADHLHLVTLNHSLLGTNGKNLNRLWIAAKR